MLQIPHTHLLQLTKSISLRNKTTHRPTTQQTHTHRHSHIPYLSQSMRYFFAFPPKMRPFHIPRSQTSSKRPKQRRRISCTLPCSARRSRVQARPAFFAVIRLFSSLPHIFLNISIRCELSFMIFSPSYKAKAKAKAKYILSIKIQRSGEITLW